MKITAIETFVVDAGWRPWQYVAVRTDEGITGYGEMSDGRNPYGIVGAVTDFFPILKGQDPLAVEKRYWDMYRLARQSTGGIAAKAIAKKPKILEVLNIVSEFPDNPAMIAPTIITDEIAFVTDINGVWRDGVTLQTT